MRTTIIFLLGLCVLFVSGCSSTPDDSIQFSIFSFPSPTPLGTQVLGSTTTWSIPGKTTSGDSLIIVQESIDTGASYTGRVQNNINSLTNQYPRLMLTSQYDANISCAQENIAGSIAQWTLSSRPEDEDPLYLAQYFFIYNTDAFVLSFASLDADATKNIVSYRHDISCN